MNLFGRILGANPAHKAARPVVHLINPMNNPFGGSENRTAELYALLSGVADVSVWSEHKICNELAQRLPIKKINSHFGKYPKGGTLVFIGCYFRIGSWIKHFKPGRVIGLYNTPDEQNLEQFLAYLRAVDLESVCEFVYASEWLRTRTALPGVVQMSPIDLNRFRPAPRRLLESRRFTVGRLSRDVLAKHHPEDIAVYQSLAGMGITSRIMGGTVLKEVLGDEPGVVLLPEGTEPAEVFFQSLDCFFYRTSPEWREPHGRVVTEAMASGLPVVCGSDGGYCEFLEHEKNGFLFDDNLEALEIIKKLCHEPEYAAQIGIAARKAMEEKFSESAMLEVASYYLNSSKVDHKLHATTVR